MPMGSLAAEVAYERDRMSTIETSLTLGMQEEVDEIPAPIVHIDDV